MAQAGHIISEECNPFAAMVVGRLYARVAAAKERDDRPDIEAAYAELWYAVNALNKLSIAIKTATHFSIAANNHVRMVAQLVREDLGLDPERHPMWN